VQQSPTRTPPSGGLSKCEQLNELKDNTVGEVVRDFSDTISKYSDCAGRVQDWIDWYYRGLQ
jgi:hypothetical protein